MRASEREAGLCELAVRFDTCIRAHLWRVSLPEDSHLVPSRRKRSTHSQVADSRLERCAGHRELADHGIPYVHGSLPFQAVGWLGVCNHPDHRPDLVIAHVVVVENSTEYREVQAARRLVVVGMLQL